MSVNSLCVMVSQGRDAAIERAESLGCRVNTDITVTRQGDTFTVPTKTAVAGYNRVAYA